MAQTPDLYARIYGLLDAAVSRYDCGRKCAPLNGGEPVCCTTANAVPIADKAEWRLLKSRTDLWSRYKATDPGGKAVVDSLPSSCVAIECKGAAHCERDNRTLACRAFPFFPYLTKGGAFVGLAYFWTFEDRCWVMSNLQIVEPAFVDEFCAAYDLLFANAPDEKDANMEMSRTMRRVFTRWGRIIPLIGRDAQFYAVEPGTHVIRKARVSEYQRHPVFADEPPARGAARERPPRRAVSGAGVMVESSGGSGSAKRKVAISTQR